MKLEAGEYFRSELVELLTNGGGANHILGNCIYTTESLVTLEVLTPCGPVHPQFP